MPKEVLDAAELDAEKSTGERDPKLKLDYIREQQEKIQEELAQTKVEEGLKEALKEQLTESIELEKIPSVRYICSAVHSLDLVIIIASNSFSMFLTCGHHSNLLLRNWNLR